MYNALIIQKIAKRARLYADKQTYKHVPERIPDSEVQAERVDENFPSTIDRLALLRKRSQRSSSLYNYSEHLALIAKST